MMQGVDEKQLNWLARIYREAPVGLCFLDTNLRYIHINEWLAAINGLSVEEHLGRTISEVLPDVAAGVTPQLRSVIETGKPILKGTVEAETSANAGTKKHFEHTYHAVKSDNGAVIGVSCIVHEVTDQKRAEERYHDLYDNAPDMFASVDAATAKIVNCNNTLADATGYSKDEILALPHISNLYHSDSEETSKEVFASYTAGREVRNVELLLMRKDGSTIDVSLNVSVIQDESGNVVLSRSIWRDITERKQAEREVRESEKLFRTLAETAPVLVGISQDYHQVYVNAAAEALTGYSREELSTLNSLSYVHPDYRELVRQRGLKRYANEDVSNRYEMKIITKSGEERWIDYTAAPITYKGKPAVLGMAFDITEQKQAQQTLHEQNVDLEERVAQRTAELKEANVELGAFARSVSHELQAPLRSMVGFAQALLEDYTSQLDVQGLEYATRIIGAANRMDVLIQDLLTYSQVSRAELNVEPVELDRVVQESLAQLDTEIEVRKARIILEGRFPSVLGDRSTLVRLTTNLLSNAMRFVDEGVAPCVTIRAESFNDRARLWVEDNGIGIDREHREKIFHVFERLHGIESYPGTGIGLAIVHRAAERMNGRVGVESTPDQGSRFWVDLPNAE